MRIGFATSVLAALAVVGLPCVAQQSASALPDSPQQQQSLPDSPHPRLIPNASQISPGSGSSASDDQSGAAAPQAPTPQAPAQQTDNFQSTAPEIQPETGPGGRVMTLHTNVNYVQLSFTVKDRRGQLVPGITWRDVRVFENGVRQHISFFSVDPFPLSVAFVIDQSLSFDTMERVNDALGAIQGAFTPYDSLAIITYNNGPTLRTDFTGAQSARIPAVLERFKSPGREATPMLGGPLAQNIDINNGANAVQMPNVNATHGHGPANVDNLPKEIHTLNDAIFMAAQALAKQPQGRRRIIYVVSDGREAGSTTKTRENIRYLQTNGISLYATVVGGSATPYVGFLDRYHLPFMMRDNILPQYAAATGGEAISEYRVRGIEDSFQRIGEDVRLQYTVGYYSHEPVLDGKYRRWEVQVMKPDLTVIAPPGYFPTPKGVTRPTQQRLTSPGARP